MHTNTKKLTVKKTNVDSDYNRQVKQFAHDYKQLQPKRKKLKQIQAKYDLISQKGMSEMTSDEITSFYRLKNEINDLTKEIEDLEQMTNVTDFYLRTGELLIDYYDSVDQKLGKKQENKNKQDMTNVPTLLQFFGNKSLQSGNITTSNETSSESNTHNKINSSSQRADLYEQYLVFTDPHHVLNPIHNKVDDFCYKCEVYRELIPNEAVLVCPKCGDEVATIIESDKPSYRDPPHENMYFAYKRINHFKEQLSHFQAKETTKIPQEIYDIILIEFKKEKRTNLATLTRSRVKKYLQKYGHLGYNKYYENINQIICHLNGIQPFYMKPEVEEQLCNMFQKIQEPFEKHCPSGRTNFLSYSYVIYKFCQLLGYDQYLPYFSLLKSKDKLRQQDKIWKNICLDIGWKFYPSSY